LYRSAHECHDAGADDSRGVTFTEEERALLLAGLYELCIIQTEMTGEVFALVARLGRRRTLIVADRPHNEQSRAAAA
jgi:hypothetical protein